MLWVLCKDVEDELLKASGLPSWNLSDCSNVSWKAVYGSQYNEGKGFVGYQPALGEATTRMRQVRMCFLFTKNKRVKKITNFVSRMSA
jgi:hypothetical protein